MREVYKRRLIYKTEPPPETFTGRPSPVIIGRSLRSADGIRDNSAKPNGSFIPIFEPARGVRSARRPGMDAERSDASVPSIHEYLINLPS
jgi:hypothetical protein